MQVGLSVLTIFIAALALVKGVDLFITSITHFARRLKISGYTISFFLVALGTSLPETVVAITSGIEKNTILAFGTALGSNMALMTIVIAIPAIFGKGLSTRTALNSKDIYFTAIFSLLPLVLAIDGTISRFDGILMITGYVLYAYAVIKRAAGLERIRDTLERPHIVKNLAIFLFALGVLLGASEIIVRTAISLSTQLSISLGLIGLTITALGTALPEMAFTVAAIKKHAREEIIGNVIGSVVANSTLVLGIAALIFPIDLLNSTIGLPTIFFVLLTLLVFLRFAKTRERIDYKEGAILLFLYLLFVATEVYLAF